MGSLEKYFSLEQNYSFCSYTIPWLKQEIQKMTKNVEVLFAKIENIEQLKNIMKHLNSIFLQFDKKGMSAKYIFDLYFLNDIKLSLESLFNHCIKPNNQGLLFELKEFEIDHNEKKLKLNFASELSDMMLNLSKIISEFIIEFINNKKNFTGVIFLEEFFFETLLTKDFVFNLKNMIIKNMSNNMEVQPFFDNTDTMATSNEILINYGISILSIETLLDFFIDDLSTNILALKTSVDCLRSIKVQISEIKSNYFSNLFRIKIENHFFKFFDQNKDILNKDTQGDIKEPHKAFFVFFMFCKNLSKILKSRVLKQNHLEFFIMDNQFVNFLKIIESLKTLNKLYDTEFNFEALGINGLLIIINGINYIYYCLNKILGFDADGKFKNVMDIFIEEIIIEFGKVKKMNIDRFLKEKSVYSENAIKYIQDNKPDLMKGI